jgi:hypothetical protein
MEEKGGERDAKVEPRRSRFSWRVTQQLAVRGLITTCTSPEFFTPTGGRGHAFEPPQ